MPSDWNDLTDYVDQCVSDAPVLKDLGHRELNLDETKQLARRHYAEIRTFIDLKLPARMRLCPHDAYRAKKFFWSIYREEQGDFKPGRSHAEVFKLFCAGVGLSDAELYAEYSGYWPNYQYLLDEPPSLEALVRELAVSYAWESIILRIAGPLTRTLNTIATTHRLTAEQLSYFPDHIEVDQEHGALALEVLNHYASTEALQELSLTAIRKTLVERNPWILPLLPQR